jgi:excisionase family DNA binding protein
MTQQERRERQTNIGSRAVLLTVPEVSERLKTSQWTIYKLLRERQLESIKIGARRLIPLDALEAFIDARREPALTIGGRYGT